MPWGWFSANEDGEVVAKTNVEDSGRVNRYPYTEPDDITAGHGHTTYDDMDKFLKDDPRWSRDKDDDESIGRPWFGPGYNFEMETPEEIDIPEITTTTKLLLKLSK